MSALRLVGWAAFVSVVLTVAGLSLHACSPAQAAPFPRVDEAVSGALGKKANGGGLPAAAAGALTCGTTGATCTAFTATTAGTSGTDESVRVPGGIGFGWTSDSANNTICMNAACTVYVRYAPGSGYWQFVGGNFLNGAMPQDWNNYIISSYNSSDAHFRSSGVSASQGGILLKGAADAAGLVACAAGQEGHINYQRDTKKVRVCDGTNWVDLH